MGDGNSSETRDEKDLGDDHERVTETLTLEEKRKNFGAKLKALRVGLDQTELDIIHLTRISPPFIDALEEGNFDALPGEVFGRGFIKNICKVLETDPEPLLQDYNACWEQKTPKGRSTKYSRKLLTHKYRSEYRNRSSLSLTNYFSQRGLILWIVGPAILLVSGILVFLFTPNAGTEQGSAGAESETVAEVSAASENDGIKDAKKLMPSSEPESGDESGRLSSPVGEEYLSDESSPEIEGGGDPEGSSETEVFSPGASDSGNEARSPLTTGSLMESDSEGAGRILIKVLSDVSIKLTLDGALKDKKFWKKGSYSLSFQDTAELSVDQPDQVQVFFNGKSLGPSEGGLRDRHLSFFNSKLQKAKL